jgi:hypothetical protein
MSRRGTAMPAASYQDRRSDPRRGRRSRPARHAHADTVYSETETKKRPLLSHAALHKTCIYWTAANAEMTLHASERLEHAISAYHRPDLAAEKMGMYPYRCSVLIFCLKKPAVVSRPPCSSAALF